MVAKEYRYLPIDRAVLNVLADKVVALALDPPDKRRNRTAHKGLRDLIDPTVVDAIESEPTPDSQTRRLRIEIGKYLTGVHPQAVKSGLAIWVVSNWGSVTQGTEELPLWTAELSNFDKVSVDAFKKKMVHNRMSSWTKIIAFADHKKYPIYDANNAVALNVLMEPLSTSNLFYMPLGQNMYVAAARAKLIARHKTRRGEYPDLGGYEDYEYLIKRVAERGKLKDVRAAAVSTFSWGGATVPVKI